MQTAGTEQVSSHNHSLKKNAANVTRTRRQFVIDPQKTMSGNFSSAAKRELRKRIKIALKNVPVSEKERQSSKVCGLLLKHEVYAASRNIAIFLSMDDEVRTHQIMEDIFR